MKKLRFCLAWVICFYIQYCCAAFKLQKLRGKNSHVRVWNKTEAEFVDLNGNFSSYNSKEPFYCSIQGLTVQVLTHNMEPYIKSQINSSIISGFLGDMWHILEEVLRFKSNITAIKNFSLGREMIKSYEADIFLAALVYNKQTTNIYFSQPYFRSWYHLYFKLPEGKPPSYLHFETFSGQLWAYLLMVFFCLTVTLWLTCATLHKLVPRGEVLLSVPTYFLGVISAFFNTGYDLKLRSCAARLQIFIALVFGVLCYYALCASLVASLASLDRPTPFTTLDEIAEIKTHSLCLRNITFVYDNFTNSDRTILPKWQGIVNNGKCPQNMLNWKSIPDAICQDNVVILENRIVMALALQHHLQCQVTLLAHRLFGTGNYIAISKKFKERKAISVM